MGQDNDEKDEKKRAGKSKYFFPDTEPFGLALGLQALRGYFISVRPSFKQLMVNINVAMAAFYVPGKLVDAMLAFQQQTGGLPNEFFEKLKVVTTHLGYPRKKAILQIMGTTPRATRFQCDEFGGQVTVEEYFRRSKSPFLYICSQVLTIAQSTGSTLFMPIPFPLSISAPETDPTLYLPSYARFRLVSLSAAPFPIQPLRR